MPRLLDEVREFCTHCRPVNTREWQNTVHAAYRIARALHYRDIDLLHTQTHILIPSTRFHTLLRNGRDDKIAAIIMNILNIYHSLSGDE